MPPGIVRMTSMSSLLSRGKTLSVIVLNSYCHAQGGASRVAIDEAVGLANMGVSVIFLGAVGPVSEELSHPSIRVVCLEQRDLASVSQHPAVMLQGLWNLPANRSMRSILRDLDPRSTIIHVHGYSQALSASPVRRALDGGFKVVCTLHEFFTACPNGAFFDYPKSSPCGRRALSASCIVANCDKRHYSHKLYRVARTLAQQIGGLPSAVTNYIALSQRSMELLTPYLPTDARIFRLPNPVVVSKTPAVDAAGNRKVIAIGRLEPEKGIHVLMEAARLSSLQLTLVGDGPLRTLAEASGHCTVTGWLPREKVSAELESARCLVFPSICYETYGLGVEEAMARGVPAIVSNITAAAERVKNGISGWHAQAGDAYDLARCLALTQNDALIKSAGQSAYAQFWSQPTDLERHVDALMRIYCKILADLPP